MDQFISPYTAVNQKYLYSNKRSIIYTAIILTVLSLVLLIISTVTSKLIHYSLIIDSKPIAIQLDLGAYRSCYSINNNELQCKTISSDCTVELDSNSNQLQSIQLYSNGQCSRYNAARILLLFAVILTVVTLISELITCTDPLYWLHKSRITAVITGTIAILAAITSMSLIVHLKRTESRPVSYSYGIIVLILSWPILLTSIMPFIVNLINQQQMEPLDSDLLSPGTEDIRTIAIPRSTASTAAETSTSSSSSSAPLEVNYSAVLRQAIIETRNDPGVMIG